MEFYDLKFKDQQMRMFTGSAAKEGKSRADKAKRVPQPKAPQLNAQLKHASKAISNKAKSIRELIKNCDATVLTDDCKLETSAPITQFDATLIGRYIKYKFSDACYTGMITQFYNQVMTKQKSMIHEGPQV